MKASYESRWGHKRTRTLKGEHAAQKERKRIEAEERNAIWRSLSTVEKLESLDRRGYNHTKQYKKLLSDHQYSG